MQALAELLHLGKREASQREGENVLSPDWNEAIRIQIMNSASELVHKGVRDVRVYRRTLENDVSTLALRWGAQPKWYLGYPWWSRGLVAIFTPEGTSAKYTIGEAGWRNIDWRNTELSGGKEWLSKIFRYAIMAARPSPDVRYKSDADPVQKPAELPYEEKIPVGERFKI